MRGEFEGSGGGGVDYINGIVRQCQVKGIVTAGDFVKLITDYQEATGSIPTLLNSNNATDQSIYKVSTTALNESTVVITYVTGTNASNKTYVCACTVLGEITIGTPILVASLSNDVVYGLKLVTMDSTHVCIVMSASYSKEVYERTKTILCSVIGTEITLGTTCRSSYYAQNSSNTLSAIALDSNNVLTSFSSYGTSNDGYLRYLLFTVTSGATGGPNEFVDIKNLLSANWVYTHLVRLSNDRAVNIICNPNKKTLYYQIITISNNTIAISPSTPALLNITVGSVYSISVTSLSEDKILLAYDGKVCICTVSNNKLTKGVETLINPDVNTGNATSVTRISESIVFITYGGLYMSLCEIDGDVITIKKTMKIADKETVNFTLNTVMLNESKFAVFYRDQENNYLYGSELKFIDNAVKTITNETERINGIAQSDGTDGQVIDVVVPDFNNN